MNKIQAVSKTKKVTAVLAIVLACVCALTVAGCSSSQGYGKYDTLQDGKLICIGSLDFPPFENLDDNKPVGFEVELMDAIAKKMGLQLEYKNQKFDSLVPAIAAGGQADCAASAITITDEREDQVNFSDPIIDSNQAIAVMKNSGYTKPSQLEGKTIAVQSGSTGADWAKENIKNAKVVNYDEATACFAALQAGKADAVVEDLPVAAYMVKDSYKNAKVIKEIPTGEQYGIAVNKHNTKLLDGINEALKSLQDDGTYDKIYNKWFA